MRRTSVLVVLCLAAFLAATAITYGVFQAVPHLEDEHANLFQAKVFASGKLYALSPAQPGAFFVPFVLDWGERRFSKYPPGYSLVLALGVLAHAPWLVNPLLGALALVAVFVLGRDLFGEETALIAAILAATSPMFLGLSSALLSHTLGLLLLTLFAWAFIHSMLHTPRSTLYALIAGIMLGWAALTRPATALAYAVPFGGWALWRIARRRARLWPFVVTVLIAGALAALLPLYQGALTGDPWANLYASWWGYDQVGFGPNHGPLPEGHSLWNALINAYVDLNALFTDLHGWPSLSWVLFAPGLLMAPRGRREVALLVPLAALILAYGFYWVHGSGIYGPRYWYEAMPFLWLLSARGLVKLWAWARGRRLAQSFIQVGLAALIALNVVTTMPSKFVLWRDLYSVTNKPWRAVQQAGIHNALVIVKGKLWTDYGAVLWANSLTLDGDLVFARDQGDKVNAAVIAQYPGRQVFWLEGTRLTPMRGE